MFVCAAGATFLGFKALTTPEQPPTSATSAADDSRRTAPEGRRIVLGFGVVWLFAAM